MHALMAAHQERRCNRFMSACGVMPAPTAMVPDFDTGASSGPAECIVDMQHKGSGVFLYGPRKGAR